MGFSLQWENEKRIIERLQGINKAEIDEKQDNADEEEDEEFNFEGLFEDLSAPDTNAKVSSNNECVSPMETVKSCDTQRIEFYYEAEENIKKVAELFKSSVENTKDCIPYHAYILHCDFSEVLEKYNYFLKIFGSDKNLLNVVKWDFINPPMHYRGIFSYQKETILKKINNLINLFDIDISGVVRILHYSSYYLFLSSERVIDYIINISELFEISFLTAKEMFLYYPNLITLSKYLILSRADRLSVYFSKSKSEVIELYKRYPPAMFLTPTLINTALRFNKNRTQEIKNKLFLMPWTLECITTEEDHEYCGYESLEQLLEIFEILEKIFGEVISVEKLKWHKDKPAIHHILYSNKKSFFVVCLGSCSPEDKILNLIFQEMPAIRYTAVQKNDVFCLGKYYLKIYAGLGKKIIYFSQKSFSRECLTDGTYCCEAPPLDVFKSLDDMPVLKNGKRQSFTRIVRLNKELTEKHKEYFEQIDKSILQNKEEPEIMIDWVNYIFGSLENYKNYLYLIEK